MTAIDSGAGTNEFESGGAPVGCKSGGGGTDPAGSAGKKVLSCLSIFLALKVHLVIFVSSFVMVSTVFSVSCLLFFYSHCPQYPAIGKSGGTYPLPCPMESATLAIDHLSVLWYCLLILTVFTEDKSKTRSSRLLSLLCASCLCMWFLLCMVIIFTAYPLFVLSIHALSWSCALQLCSWNIVEPSCITRSDMPKKSRWRKRTTSLLLRYFCRQYCAGLIWHINVLVSIIFN